MKEKWEYKREISEFYYMVDEFIDWLNREGKKGWELIEYKVFHKDGMCGGKYYCIFKRKIKG